MTYLTGKDSFGMDKQSIPSNKTIIMLFTNRYNATQSKDCLGHARSQAYDWLEHVRSLACDWVQHVRDLVFDWLDKNKMPWVSKHDFSLNWPHWVDSVIESQCPSVCLFYCLFAPSDSVFLEASHWP